MTDGAPRILYIDDDAGLCRLASRVLRRHGYQVTSAPDGATGLAEAATASFDLIAVDHYMPGMDGLETLQRIRELPAPRRSSMSPGRTRAASRSPR
ncbi:response regulator [Sphingomonas sp. NY01]|uniref:response regulator n=1 Tax=Sphingomonas sp. NY01 TaxID=2968057 RepID=UPI00315CC641